MTPGRWDAVVVGGGVGGLTAAHALRGRGLRVLVLEAADRCGGPVRGGALVRDDGARLAVDVGAESFASRGTGVADLAAELGLDVVAPSGRSAWIQAGGRAFPIPAAGVLGIPARPWAADVRRAIGWPGVLRASADRLLPAGRVDASDLGALVRSRYGRRVTERLVAPVATGVHSAPLGALDVDAVAPGLRAALAREGSLGGAVASLRALAPAGSAVRGVDGGVHRLVDELLAVLSGGTVVGGTVSGGTESAGGTVAGGTPLPPAEVRTGARVVGISSGIASGISVGDGGSGERSGWVVRLADGAPVLADRLVVATAGVTDGLLGPAPRRPAGSDVRLVTLLLHAPALDAAPRGTGVLVAPGGSDPGRPAGAKALTHATAKWPWLAARVAGVFGPGRHVVRLSYGRLGERTPEPTVAQAARDASVLLGVPLAEAAVEASDAVRWAGTLPPPTPAYRAAVAEHAARAEAVAGLALTGSWVAGTGLAAVVGHARAAAAAV
ncbi:NAD(P)/FAD-dependent oxidoreductase [Cellulomonas sp. PhB143]|uniref:protoporphyrinogen/coproporphyrinogen oxidase n=1 Tax=Cellulomonas sp. PhB143 TaxID=2485186 RepID=UPI000F488DFD|nr:NAD(P)-binding protein [Cellulomonas sp. PhB143]ROS79082.1 oxygen-dependent protoporphyrinogen oxidase [Cellulomonas sp. PhB143]